MMNESDYIVYIDESGDHGLTNTNKYYPILVLSFCIFKKEDYIQKIVPSFQRLKFKYFGHDQVVFHENEIRKQKKCFSFLRGDEKERELFMQDLSQMVTDSPFIVCPVVINKERLQSTYSKPINPYSIASLFGIERVYKELIDLSQQGKTIYFVFEKRGKKEDFELELILKKIFKRDNLSKMKLRYLFVDKKSNCTGLQFADLVSRPIGIFKLNNKKNRAYEAIEHKIKRFKYFP